MSYCGTPTRTWKIKIQAFQKSRQLSSSFPLSFYKKTSYYKSTNVIKKQRKNIAELLLFVVDKKKYLSQKKLKANIEAFQALPIKSLSKHEDMHFQKQKPSKRQSLSLLLYQVTSRYN